MTWADLCGHALYVPVQVEASLTAYAQSYHALKTPRKLQWKRHLGTVELDVAVGSKTLQLSVTPAQASLLLHFNGQATLPLAKLAQLMGVAVPTARNVALFWVAKGVQTDLLARPVHSRHTRQAETSSMVSVGVFWLHAEAGASRQVTLLQVHHDKSS